ncbi:MAG TPA: LLM class flavin-dependent oxidoreductase [Xanthobacteraceae bacterium]|nr:LLM class flavin-dependent oxidoreductase [Xanthobacteraceae bacterium]
MSTLPKLGLRLHSGLDPHRCVELAKAAEAHHFASVWFAENPFERGVLPAAAACAAATQRIGIGIGVWNPYTRHPSLIAMEIGALDALAQGRASLGIGSGIASAIGKLGVDNKRPLAALRDTFQIVRGLLRGGEVSYSGTVFSADKVKLGYAPPRSDLPLLMAARGDKALALAGEIADGLVISNMCPPAFTARAVEIVRKAAAKAGRTIPARVVQYVPCAPGGDGAQARNTIKPALAAMLKQYWTLAQNVPSAKVALRHSGIPEADMAAAVDQIAAGDRAEDILDDRFIDTFAIAGSAEQCRERISAYARAGVSELALTLVGAQPIADMEYLGRALATR